MLQTARKAVVILLLSTAVHADGVYPLNPVSVYDGDTFRADIYIDPFDIVLVNQPIRLLRVDTPEMFGKCSEERLLADIAKNILKIRLAGAVTADITGKDSFGRWLAHVYTDGESVADVLIAEKLTGPRGGWCK